MRWRIGIGATIATTALGVAIALLAARSPDVISVEESALREYAGVYQAGPDAFIYVQIWTEVAANSLVAFDESGEVRTLYPTDADRFFAGPGIAVSTTIESRVEFRRDASGAIASLTWQRGDSPPRFARRVDTERREGVAFSNDDVRLAGTLFTPRIGGRHPAVILVHGSGPADREWALPFARFLIRHGMAVLGYDKRGVGESTGDWNTASFDDLAGDVVAAFDYLRKRSDIDGEQVGLLGVSQAGWIMPLAAVRAEEIAFLISISGAAVPAAETVLDHAQNEMRASGMRPEMTAQMIELMKLQYRFAETGRGWEEYAAGRARIAAQMGPPPESFPGDPDSPRWGVMRRLYFYDPAPTLRELRTPTLALFGERDNNILPDKNKAAWESALREGGSQDYTLEVLPRANHLLLEARSGTNAEMTELQRFVPAYFTTVRDWLAERLDDFGERRAE